MTKHTLKEWMIAVRPWSIPASAMPIIVTLAYLFWKEAEINWLYGIWALVGMILFHLAGNVWSDWFDFRKKVDAEDTFGAKTLTTGMFEPKEIRNLAVGLLAASVACGLGLAAVTGIELLYIGIAGAVLTVLYPFLKYNALGDLDILLTFAFLPTLGTSFAATGTIDWNVLLIALPVGLITDGILHSNNTRDIASDRVAQIKAQIAATKSDYDKEKLQERLAKLAGGVAVIKVGAATETEMKEKKDRVDDALCATRAAIEEGIVPGGGVAYIRAIDALEGLKGDNADETTGIEIIKRAVEEPLRQIVSNAGKEGAVVVQKVREGKGDFGYNARTDVYENMKSAGVVDPAQVTRVALENAASIAGIFLEACASFNSFNSDSISDFLSAGNLSPFYFNAFSTWKIIASAPLILSASSFNFLSASAYASASAFILLISSSLKPDEASILMLCDLPVALSFADTFKIPFESMSNVTSICGTPRGAGGMLSKWNLPIVLF